MARAGRRARELTYGSLAGFPETTETSEPRAVSLDSENREPVQGGPAEPKSISSGTDAPAKSASASTCRPRHARGKTALQASVALVAALVFAFGGALAALHLREPSEPPSVASVGGPGAQSRHHLSPAPRQTAPPAKPVGGSDEKPLAGAVPRLISVSPSSGATGQVMTVSGTNLYSPDGLVQASLGGADAPVRCVTQTACMLTVPAGLGSPRSLPLTIETEAGTSNALSFSYK